MLRIPSYGEINLIFCQSVSREKTVEEMGTSINDTALVSIDGNARTWAEYILRLTKAHKQPEITKMPLDDSKSIYVCF